VKPLARPDAQTIASVRALAERELSLEEWRAGLATPMGEEEEAEILSLVRWFCRRYPTPADRLAYARRAYRRWTRAQLSETVTPSRPSPDCR